MEYANLTKKEMMDLIEDLMIEQRLDPQDFIEISLNYATDEEIMVYTQHRHYEGDFDDFEIDNGSTRRTAIIDSVYDGGWDDKKKEEKKPKQVSSANDAMQSARDLLDPSAKMRRQKGY